MNKRTLKSIILLSLTLLVVLFTLPALAAEPTSTPQNLPPTTEELSLETFRGVAVSGLLVAVDPEGDLLEYQIVRAPRKGEIALDSATGQFTFTPEDGARGRDHFTFVAIDALGNVSAETTVRIRIERQSTAVVYEDMFGHPAHLAAVTLAEQGIFVGEQIGGRYVFRPDQSVQRGEFLAMAMRLADADILSGIVRTGFSDDAYIADWLKPYVSTAVLEGVIHGRPGTGGNVVFAPDDPITISEAAVVLNQMLGLADIPVSATTLSHVTSPGWAHQAAVNLIAHNMIPIDIANAYTTTLTRADVAILFLQLSDMLTGTSPSAASLLGWAV